MKQYKITKIVFAKDFVDAVLKEKKAEIIDVALNEEVAGPKATKVGY